jgi:hypothetical protein
MIGGQLLYRDPDNARVDDLNLTIARLNINMREAQRNVILLTCTYISFHDSAVCKCAALGI